MGVYVCTATCRYAYVDIYVFIYFSVYVYVYIFIYLFICICTHIRICTRHAYTHRDFNVNRIVSAAQHLVTYVCRKLFLSPKETARKLLVSQQVCRYHVTKIHHNPLQKKKSTKYDFGISLFELRCESSGDTARDIAARRPVS